MRYIPMSIIQHKFDELGNIIEIQVSYAIYEGVENFSARIVLSNDYLQDIDENLKIENLSQGQIDTYARRYLYEWLETEKDSYAIKSELKNY